MVRSEKVGIRGTKYYAASRLYHARRLHAGQPVRLKHEPLNLHDSHAVAVLLDDTGDQLGYIPRELAPVYEEWLRNGKIGAARIASVAKRNGRIHIVIDVAVRVTDSPYKKPSVAPAARSGVVDLLTDSLGEPRRVTDRPPPRPSVTSAVVSTVVDHPTDSTERPRSGRLTARTGCFVAAAVYLVILIMWPGPTLWITYLVWFILYAISSIFER